MKKICETCQTLSIMNTVQSSSISIVAIFETILMATFLKLAFRGLSRTQSNLRWSFFCENS